MVVPPAAGESQTATTDEVKAAYLFNFAKFVEWPPETPGPLVLAVMGSDSIAEMLAQITTGKTAGGRAVSARRVTAGDDLTANHLLFIGAAEQERMPEIMGRLEGSSVLTVSDVDRFCELGGVIALTQDDKHVRFEINLAAAERSRLKVSSKLLRLARRVHPVDVAGDRR